MKNKNQEILCLTDYMKKWIKYYNDPKIKGINKISIEQGPKRILSSGYCSNQPPFKTKDEFFSYYLNQFHFGRLNIYQNYLSEKLNKGNNILSIASGSCALELYLQEKGYHITCSDISYPPVYSNIDRLFPEFKFKILDIIKDTVNEKYDCIICMSLIYLFNNDDLNIFFQNISKSLTEDGILILDSAGCPQNLISTLWHDYYLKIEAYLIWITKRVISGKWDGFIIHHHGYRRTDKEIIEIAKNSGFSLKEQKNSGLLTDFRRSLVFGTLIKKVTLFEKIFKKIGKKMPYVRLYYFKKDII